MNRRIKTALNGKLKKEQAGFPAGQSFTGQQATLRIDHCGAEYRVAVLLVYQLYRFQKGLR